MKKILTILTVLTTLTGICQTYYSFPTNTAIWTVTHCSNWSGAQNFKVAMIGDTTINGKNFKKMFRSNDTIFDISNSSYLMALREENKKIYFIPDSDTTEYLIYDFTTQIGDTVKVYALDFFPPNNVFSPELREFVVSDIDSVLIDGNYRKRWYFPATSAHTDEYWIEGIGSTFGLLSPFLNITDNLFGLRCFAQDNTLLYGSSFSNFLCLTMPTVYCTDTLMTGFSNEKNELLSLNIYPNPTNAEITIEFQNQWSDRHDIDIYSILGQRIKTIWTQKEKLTIDLNRLQEGTYFVVITDRHGRRWTEKIIINAP